MQQQASERAMDERTVEARHTPGPWELGIWDRHIWVFGGPNNDDIAEFNFADEHTVKITREEAIANARLFLAAPALLRLLHSINDSADKGDIVFRDASLKFKIEAVIASAERSA